MEIMDQKKFSEVGSIDPSTKSDILELPRREILMGEILMQIKILVSGCNELLLLEYMTIKS